MGDLVSNPVSDPVRKGASIVVPAHNEARVIGRLLDGLLGDAEPGEFEVLVVCNGCSDDTAEVAEAFGDGVRTLVTPVASKREALKLGDAHASAFPRLYVDADVELSTRDARRLVARLRQPGALAAAPVRVVARDGASRLVCWYYDVWESLPQVRKGLFGRGVIAVSERGHARIARLPGVMSDDLAFSEAFGPDERTMVPAAEVVVRPPGNWADLMRRRVRVMTGTKQLHDMGLVREESRTSWRDLGSMVRAQPTLAPKVVVFLSASLLSRAAARRRVRAGDFDTWLRDESSRQASPGQPRPAPPCQGDVIP